MLGLMTWRTASWLIGRARRDREKRWAADLAAMVQVSLVGYASAGAFLGLAYFDYYYTLIALVVLCRTVLISSNAKQVAESAADTGQLPLGSRPVAAAGWSALRPSGSARGMREERG